MLPDYPKIKDHIKREFNSLARGESSKDPLLSGIQIQEVHEGDTYSITSIDGIKQDDTYKKIEARFDITKEEMMTKGPEIYFSKAKEVAKTMIEQESKQVISKLTEAAEKAGNVVDGKSKPLSPDTIFEAMEKIRMDFDEFGNPIFPTLLLLPEMLDRIRSEIPKWESDPKVMAKQREIVEKKRKEWLDRESYRKLVD
jgi:hypothetical protein